MRFSRYLGVQVDFYKFEEFAFGFEQRALLLEEFAFCTGI